MKTYYQPSGLNHGLNLMIDKDWTPEQAMAVFELLDDLRDLIFSYYQHPIQELLRDKQGWEGEYQENNHPDEPDF